jgi:integrase
MAKGGAGLTRKAVAMTHRSIEAMAAQDAPYRVPDARCPGLAVRVAPGGAKTFDCAYRIKGGGMRRLSLGAFPDVGLEAARQRAHELKKAARAGTDLVAEEKAALAEKAKRLTVGALIEKYCQKVVRGKLRTAKEIENRLKRALKPKLEIAIEDLKRRDLRELFDEASDVGHEREAEKRRQTAGAMFRWALSQDFLDADPTAGLKAYDAGKPRDRVLSNGEVRKFWNWLEVDTLPSAHADVMRVQLLLGARCGEVAGMRAEEIDTKTWLWTLPPERSKNKRERKTPLVGMAREIVANRLVKSGPVFTAALSNHGVKPGALRPLTASHVGQCLNKRKKRLPIAHFTTHDLRRTFATALDGMGVSIELIAAIVGHESSVNQKARTLVRHYLHGDKLEQKRVALEAWDRRIKAMLAGEDLSESPNVLHLHRTA